MFLPSVSARRALHLSPGIYARIQKKGYGHNCKGMKQV